MNFESELFFTPVWLRYRSYMAKIVSVIPPNIQTILHYSFLIFVDIVVVVLRKVANCLFLVFPFKHSKPLAQGYLSVFLQLPFSLNNINASLSSCHARCAIVRHQPKCPVVAQGLRFFISHLTLDVLRNLSSAFNPSFSVIGETCKEQWSLKSARGPSPVEDPGIGSQGLQLANNNFICQFKLQNKSPQDNS